MLKPHIVIVLDNLQHRAKIKEILTPIAADFTEVTDRTEFANLLMTIKADLVVADFVASPQKQQQWLAYLQNDPAMKHLPVIFIGHKDSPQNIAACKAAGAFAYLDTLEAKEKLLPTAEKLFKKQDAKLPAAKRILIVDDSYSVRLLLEEGLRHEGYEVLIAVNGKNALEILNTTRPDLILSDVYMPEMNGLELCQILHEDPQFSSVPIVVMSTENDQENMKKMLQYGAAAFIIKPFKLEQLIMTLNKIFSYEFLLLLKENERLESEQKLLVGGITSLVKALEARDHYTRGHSERVATILARLVQHMGGSRRDIERAQIAGRLHDIGKIGIRDDVLLKPGRLTDEEFNLIKEHPEIGASIIQTIPSIADILPVVFSHHERIDGKGYPQGLQGEGIPLWARLTAVADTYDALSSDRPYRQGMTHDKAVAVIKEVSGTQLCAESVRLFFDLYKDEISENGILIP